MNIPFYKYQGAGNDFVMIDARTKPFDPRQELVERMCHRRYGIGADGLIVLAGDADPGVDFSMDYFNSDGRRSTMCGNGARCIAALARDLGIGTEQGVRFRAPDGLHQAFFEGSLVRLGMNDVPTVQLLEKENLPCGALRPRWVCFLDTGSPHCVVGLDDGLETIDLARWGRAIRHGAMFAHRGGTNVDFVQLSAEGVVQLRTYERGVEDETLACGTGAVASAIAVHRMGETSNESVPVKALGGDLTVDFHAAPQGSYTRVWLTGGAQRVFSGTFYSMPQ